MGGVPGWRISKNSLFILFLLTSSKLPFILNLTVLFMFVTSSYGDINDNCFQPRKNKK